MTKNMRAVQDRQMQWGSCDKLCIQETKTSCFFCCRYQCEKSYLIRNVTKYQWKLIHIWSFNRMVMVSKIIVKKNKTEFLIAKCQMLNLWSEFYFNMFYIVFIVVACRHWWEFVHLFVRTYFLQFNSYLISLLISLHPFAVSC